MFPENKSNDLPAIMFASFSETGEVMVRNSFKGIIIHKLIKCTTTKCSVALYNTSKNSQAESICFQLYHKYVKKICLYPSWKKLQINITEQLLIFLYEI